MNQSLHVNQSVIYSVSRYGLTWINRLFILFNALCAYGIVHIYSIRPPKEDDFTDLAFGEGAPLFGSEFLEFVIGYPTGILLSVIFLLALWGIVKQKQPFKKLMYNCIFIAALLCLLGIFSYAFTLPMQTLI